MAETAPEQRQTLRFLWLYALAAAGGAVSYVPFLTLLLPVRATEMVGDANIDLLAYIAFAGAITASLANIGFGWLSDATGTRRPWIVAGLVLSCLLLVSIRATDSPTELIGLVVVWQVALNMMLAPLAAWAGDVVPDRQKGLLGGLLSFAPALGAASGALVTLPGLAGPDERLALVAALVAVMVLPVILFGRPVPMPDLTASLTPAENAPPRFPRGAVARMWLARLLVQIAEAALFAYLLIWLTGIDGSFTDSDTARIFALVLGLSVPLALLAGRWSDRRDRPIMPLAWGAGVGALGLVAMALAQGIEGAIAGYLVFGLSTSVFLALHSSQTLRVLPKPATRGRDLGLFNLTNTVPSLIMPWLTLALVPLFGFSGLFFLLACLATLATILLLTMPRSPTPSN
ncbi:MFS transporter [Erythrobacter sp. SD-21]|uniref:MFS transporter n=1 Tax=Erythrobacter sp. SD-21 TaxID=161528 RepID=UPI000153F985|nr:MFS transporter [Erythrobacter sp. SD-21]EDL48766.1 major facilitator superfamily MFS_1 [Erythrobacter sp. SD-21]